MLLHYVDSAKAASQSSENDQKFIFYYFYLFHRAVVKQDHYMTHMLSNAAPHCKENPIYVLPGKKLRGLSPIFHVNDSVSDLYFPHDRSAYFPAAEYAD